MKTHKFARKPFYVDAVRVSEANLADVATWCEGTPEETDDGQAYIKVKVHRPLTERQTQAFVGDWVLFAGTGFKVYTPKAFDKSFEKVKTLTKAQADEAGIKVPHEARPKNEKKAPVPTPPKRHKPISDLGKALRDAGATKVTVAQKGTNRTATVNLTEEPPAEKQKDEADRLIDEVLRQK